MILNSGFKPYKAGITSSPYQADTGMKAGIASTHTNLVESFDSSAKWQLQTIHHAQAYIEVVYMRPIKDPFLLLKCQHSSRSMKYGNTFYLSIYL